MKLEETLSAAEFQFRYERKIGKLTPSLEHARFEKKLVSALERALGEEYEVLAELTLALPDRHAVPDVSVFYRADLPVSEYEAEHSVIELVPLVTVEILTTTQPLSEVIDKARAYLRAGAKSCWVVSLSMKCVFLYVALEKYEYFHGQERLRDPATGIELDLAPLFE